MQLSAQKAKNTMSGYTEVVPVHASGVRFMELDVASCVLGDFLYARDFGKLDKMEEHATKTMIERFSRVFFLDDVPKVDVGWGVNRSSGEAVGHVTSFSGNGFHRVNFPFFGGYLPINGLEKIRNYSTTSNRRSLGTGSNMVVDKYMKLFGNVVADEGGAFGYNMYGSDSGGFMVSSKIVGAVGRNHLAYERLPKSERSSGRNLLLNRRFIQKRVDYKNAVVNYINEVASSSTSRA